MRSRWTIWLAVLIVVNIVLGVQLFRVRNDDATGLYDIRSFVKNPVLPNVELFDQVGESLPLRQTIDELASVLVVILSPSDCPTCFNEKVLWSKAATLGDINVIGIACSADRDEFWKWKEIAEIPIAVYLDTSYAVIDSLRSVVTPMKLLLNRSGVAVWADPPRLEEHTIQAFMEDLGYAMAEYL